MAKTDSPKLRTYRLVLVPAFPLVPLVAPGRPAFEFAVVHAAVSRLSGDDTVLNIRGLELGDTVQGALSGIAERTVNFEADLVSGESRAWGTARLALDHIGDLDCQWAGTLTEGAMWACRDGMRMLATYSIGSGGSMPVGPVELNMSWAGA